MTNVLQRPKAGTSRLTDEALLGVLDQWVVASRDGLLQSQQGNAAPGGTSLVENQWARLELERDAAITERKNARHAATMARQEVETLRERVGALLADVTSLRAEIASLRDERDNALSKARVATEHSEARHHEVTALRREFDLVLTTIKTRETMSVPSGVLLKTDAPGLFDETWYLNLYADVREAVAQGSFISGEAHYLRHGRSEGRLARFLSAPSS